MLRLGFRRLLPILPLLLCLSVTAQRKWVVDEIEIQGNEKTKDVIILRELPLQVGDTLSLSELIDKRSQAQVNLVNTSLFNTVRVEYLPSEKDSAHAVKYQITVTERWYFWPYPILEFVDPNFNLWWETKDLSRTNIGINFHWQNFRGRNENLYFLGQLGYSKAIGLTYEIPWINKGQRWGISIAPLYEQRDEVVSGTEDGRRILIRSGTGRTREVMIGAAGLSYRRKLYITHRLQLKYQQTSVMDTVLKTRPDYLGDSINTLRYPGISYSYRIDRRNNRAYPQSGHFLDAKLAFRGLGMTSTGMNVIWLTVDARKYIDLGRWGLSAGVKAKANLGDRLPYFFQEGLGYSQYMRGYEYYIIDGQHYGLFKSDIRYTVVTRKTKQLKAISDTRFNSFYYAIHLSAFADAGYVVDEYYATENPLSNDWQGSVGIGMHVETFYDKVFRFEVAYNRQKEFGYYIHFTQPI